MTTATKTTRKPKMTVAHMNAMDAKNRRAARLAEIQEAIADGRAYLLTAWGRRKVVGYHDETGNVFTNNTGRPEDDRTFMVCLGSILID